MDRSVRVALAVVACLGLVAATGPASLGKKPQSVVLIDTLVDDQVYPCGTRPIEPGTTNGYAKEAASFTVAEPTNVTSVVLPLSVSPRPAKVEVSIVAAEPWDGTDPANLSGSGSWDNRPDESAVIGRPSAARVEAITAPCGPADIVTVDFRKAVPVVPGVVYWVVVQDREDRKTATTFQWVNGVSHSADSAIAIYIVDGNGSRWLSYDPDQNPWRSSAMRVLGES